MSDTSRRIEEAAGKAKEAAGKVTGDRDTEREGQLDQAKAKAAQAADTAKDKLKGAGEKLKDALGNDEE